MADKLTDAELVECLKLIHAHGGNVSKAARAGGYGRSSLTEQRSRALAKGLTHETEVTDPVAKLKNKLKLAEQTIQKLQRDNETAESVRRVIYQLSELSPEPPEWLNKDKDKDRDAKSPGVPMVLMSDFHWGEVVQPVEVGGVNEFNLDVAHSRFKKLIDSIIDLTHHHMVNPDYPGIVVCLGGDMVSGNIHEELRETNALPILKIVDDILDHLTAGIETLADKFGQVFIPCVVGNHGRLDKKPRMKGRVFENYEWNLYVNLERHFRKDKRVQFYVPGETDAYFSVLGHRFLLTHGDALGVKGGDGIIGSLGPIMRGAMKVGRSEAQIGREFDTILMGHWHQYLPLPKVIVNGTLKGYDEFARIALRAPYERPSQALWFVHAKHGITAQWPIYLDEKHIAQEQNEWVSWMRPVGV